MDLEPVKRWKLRLVLAEERDVHVPRYSPRKPSMNTGTWNSLNEVTMSLFFSHIWR